MPPTAAISPFRPFLRAVLFLLFISSRRLAQACIGTTQQAFQAQQPTINYPAQAQGVPQYIAPGAFRAAASPNLAGEGLQPLGSGGEEAGGGHLEESLVGPRVQLTEFSSSGYNAEGGGPVAHSGALQCDFEGRPCCWANVPSPDDQIDWHAASGVPQSQIFQNVTIEGRYLVAYAASAAPSDEAQFASCSIGCASSNIRVRARHWQSSNVLLQVCQRESFPNTVSYNPLLNCQEFPMTQGMGFTELVLPKASLVDIVFVASNFVSDQGDIAVLDNIEVVYTSDPRECEAINGASSSSSLPAAASTSPAPRGGVGDNTLGPIKAGGPERSESSHGRFSATEGKSSSQAKASSATGGRLGAEIDGTNAAVHASSISSSATSAAGASSAAASKTLVATEESEGNAAASSTVIGGIRACQRTKCTFEDGTTCHYKDIFETQEQEVHEGLTTRFQVVQGQFMNRVTGVPGSVEGNYYAATFLYPRERAGIVAGSAGETLAEERRLRFQYYEGTHGVQLKGCCDSIDVCPFSSDKFVTVSDRMWKFGSFSCPRGTQKVIFLCENTRTNQGACALDDVQVVENNERVTLADQPLC